MKNMKISMKLIISFMIVIVLTVVVGVVGIIGLNQMTTAAEDMYTSKARPLGDIAHAMEYFQRTRVQSRNAIIYSGNSERLSSIESDLNSRFSEFEYAMNTYKPTLAPEAVNVFDELMSSYNNSYKPGVLQVLAKAKTGENSVTLMGELETFTNAANMIAADLTSLTDIRMNVMSSANNDNKSLGSMLLVIIIAVIAISIVISLTLAFYISSIISKPMSFLAQIMDGLTQTGNFHIEDAMQKRVEDYGRQKDEVGQIAKAFDGLAEMMIGKLETLEQVSNGDISMTVTCRSTSDSYGNALQKVVANLNNMFGEINNATTQVASGSKQIADGSQALAQGSTEQAAAVEQLSSSISEIAQKTKTNAEMAGKASDLANTIKQNAEKGSRQMDEMMSAVKEINEASQSINKVIGVIDNIAFQTNILALNAAVEAARAGQHGKGFAVVAEEVRSLASKSADAAKETGALIANSMEKAELGARIADETAASLVEIVSGINESTQLVGEIARSSEEQSEGISQVNKGIDQVAQVVQQNSATAEESAAASEELSGQSNLLEDLISQFKLKDGMTRKSLPASTPKHKRQLVMPERTEYAQPINNNDFGKY